MIIQKTPRAKKSDKGKIHYLPGKEANNISNGYYKKINYLV